MSDCPPNRLEWLRARLTRMGKRRTVRKSIHLAQAARSHRERGERAKAEAGRCSNQWSRSPCFMETAATYASATELWVQGVNPHTGGGVVEGEHACPSRHLPSLVPTGNRRAQTSNPHLRMSGNPLEGECQCADC